jgi:hypothetical protein
MRLPDIDSYLPAKITSKTVERFLETMKPKLKILQEICKRNNAESQLKSKQYYDQKANEPHFVVDEQVLLYNPGAKRKGDSPKLTCYWQGPYRIVEKLSDSVVILLDLQTLKTTIPVNIDRLKRYVDRESFTEEWAQPELEKTAPIANQTQDLEDTGAMVPMFPAAGSSGPVDLAPAPQQGNVSPTGVLPGSIPVEPYLEIAKLLKVRKSGLSRQYLAQFVNQAYPPRWLKLQEVPRMLLQEYHSKYNLGGRLLKSVKMARRKSKQQ